MHTQDNKSTINIKWVCSYVDLVELNTECKNEMQKTRVQIVLKLVMDIYYLSFISNVVERSNVSSRIIPDIYQSNPRWQTQYINTSQLSVQIASAAAGCVESFVQHYSQTELDLLFCVFLCNDFMKWFVKLYFLIHSFK